MGAGKRMHFNF